MFHAKKYSSEKKSHESHVYQGRDDPIIPDLMWRGSPVSSREPWGYQAESTVQFFGLNYIENPSWKLALIMVIMQIFYPFLKFILVFVGYHG